MFVTNILTYQMKGAMRKNGVAAKKVGSDLELCIRDPDTVLTATCCSEPVRTNSNVGSPYGVDDVQQIPGDLLADSATSRTVAQ